MLETSFWTSSWTGSISFSGGACSLPSLHAVEVNGLSGVMTSVSTEINRLTLDEQATVQPVNCKCPFSQCSVVELHCDIFFFFGTHPGPLVRVSWWTVLSLLQLKPAVESTSPTPGLMLHVLAQAGL